MAKSCGVCMYVHVFCLADCGQGTLARYLHVAKSCGVCMYVHVFCLADCGQGTPARLRRSQKLWCVYVCRLQGTLAFADADSESDVNGSGQQHDMMDMLREGLQHIRSRVAHDLTQPSVSIPTILF